MFSCEKCGATDPRSCRCATPSRADADSEPWVVVVLHTNSNGMRLARAIPIWDEMQAHAVAEAFIDCGARAFLIDTDGYDGTPSIEEYGRDA